LRFVSPALRHLVFPILAHSGYLRHSIGSGPAVVTYHGVFPSGYQIRTPAIDGNLVPADSLRRQLQLLKKRYMVISPDEFLSWLKGEGSLPPHSVLLTCDDALQNTLLEMTPILQEMNVSCLFFATGSSTAPQPSMLWYEELYLMLLESTLPISLNLPGVPMAVNMPTAADIHPSWWKLVEQLSAIPSQTRREMLDKVRRQLELPETWRDKFIRDPALASRFLTLDLSGLRKLAGAGMTIGAHTLSHPILSRTSEEIAWHEISESRTALESALGQEIWAFAYPFGNAATVTRRELQLADQAGFLCAFMNVAGGFGAKFDRLAVPGSTSLQI
jgi:peptidoglycan/xylan/chitin deacetylase (PgdA/CDA1 family)